MRPLILVALLLLTLPARAHEFWLKAQPYTPEPGSSTAVSLRVGENFEGDLTPFVDERTAALRHYAAGSVQDLTKRLPRRTGLPQLEVPMPGPGLHLIAFDSQPIVIALAPDKFHAYLHDEGLDSVIAQRMSTGNSGKPGRERYRRYVKTLLRVGGVSDGTYAALTGQQLEITPLSDPYSATAGATMRFRLTFESKPLGAVLVKAWHKRDGQLLTLRARTNENGEVALSLPYAGEWMVSVVHMTPARDVPDADWDSYWGNLTFSLPAS